MKDIETIESVVLGVLEKHPSTRNSDTALYLAVCKKMNSKVAKMPFETVMKGRAELGIPKFDTVGRARRKLQEQNPEVRADEKVKKARANNEKRVREYARKR